MSKKLEIICTYKQKIDLLKKHNKFYFSKDKPIISDKEYDDLKKTIIDLENKNLFLKGSDLLFFLAACCVSHEPILCVFESNRPSMYGNGPVYLITSFIRFLFIHLKLLR